MTHPAMYQISPAPDTDDPALVARILDDLLQEMNNVRQCGEIQGIEYRIDRLEAIVMLLAPHVMNLHYKT